MLAKGVQRAGKLTQKAAYALLLIYPAFEELQTISHGLPQVHSIYYQAEGCGWENLEARLILKFLQGVGPISVRQNKILLTADYAVSGPGFLGQDYLLFTDGTTNFIGLLSPQCVTRSLQPKGKAGSVGAINQVPGPGCLSNLYFLRASRAD